MSAAETRAKLLTRLVTEREGYAAVLARIDDSGWRDLHRADGWCVHDIVGHIADATYGLSLLVLGEAQPNMPLDPETGWIRAAERDALNDERRRKNADLPRAKLEQRLTRSFETAARAIEATEDFDAPGPFGPVNSRYFWLTRIVAHCGIHRAELEALAGKMS